MPLHTISDVYGESGLRARLHGEASELSNAEEITDALALATELHRDDNYGREPYINHILRVGIRIISHYEVDDPEVVIAGLLHDAVEDHAGELASARSGQHTAAAVAVLAERFGQRVADLVAVVTNPVFDPGRDRYEQYRENIASRLDLNPWARVVKLSDFTDNGVGILYATGSHLRKLATKYQPLTPVYRELVTRADTPLADHVKAHILEQLDLADERFDAILSYS